MRIPRNHERLAIYGMTGSGKTTAALWHLSQRNFDQMPWVILDFKRDEHLAGIVGARILPRGSMAPTEPGIYIARPLPQADDVWVESLFWSIHAQGRTGVYVDEGYMVPRNSKAFDAILTQGRSLQIPAIVLSQRPVWLNRFVTSESEFHQIFFLNHQADRDTVQQWTPAFDMERLPRYASYYYNVSDREFDKLKPLPKAEIVLDWINARLEDLEDYGPDVHLALRHPHRFI